MIIPNSPEQKLISALQAIIDAPGGGPARRIAIQAKPEVYVVIEELAELREKEKALVYLIIMFDSGYTLQEILQQNDCPSILCQMIEQKEQS